MVVNLAIRALRWQYLLEPLGHTSFADSFRATAVGFAASSVLPARAGEVIRPYFLARQAPRDQQGRMTATGAFATIILERLLDIVTVLALLASFVFVFGKDLAGVNPTGFALVKWAGASAALVSSSALVVLFVLAGDPERWDALLPLAWRAGGVAFEAHDGVLRPVKRGLPGWAWPNLMGKPLNIARILKAAFTFDGAARYAAYKIGRHTGVEIEVTPWRERHPFLAAPGAWLELRRRQAEARRARLSSPNS